MENVYNFGKLPPKGAKKAVKKYEKDTKRDAVDYEDAF